MSCCESCQKLMDVIEASLMELCQHRSLRALELQKEAFKIYYLNGRNGKNGLSKRNLKSIPAGVPVELYDAAKELGIAWNDFERARSFVIDKEKCSAPMIQRSLKLSFSKSISMIDLLEKAGVVSAFKGTKSREVLYR